MKDLRKINNLYEAPFWLQVIAIPVAWFTMVLKLALAIPMATIAICNKLLNNNELPDKPTKS